MLKNYILIAVRNLLRNKTISFINIFGLALSMSVCLLLILIVADQYAYDNFHEKKDRTYRIITDRLQLNEDLWSTATTAYPLAELINDHESVEHTVVMKKNFSGVAQWDDAEMPFKGLYASDDFFSVFNFPLEKGNPYNALSGSNSIVLTKELAAKIFGDKDPMNQVIQVEELGEFVVTGVLEEFPGKSHMYFEALASTNYLPVLEGEGKLQASLHDWNFIYDNYIYVTIKEGADIGDLDPLFYGASEDHYDPEGDFEYAFIPQPLTGITPGPLLSNTMGFGLPDIFIYIMLGVALMVLASACFNYANLTTARAIRRAKEIGVRKVVGARKVNIIGQFVIESIVIALIAFGLGLMLLKFIHPELNNIFVSLGVPISFDATPHLFWMSVGFALLTGLLAGLPPALFFAATDPLVALKKAINIGGLGNRLGWSRLNIRKVLVVVQFTFTIFFVITIIAIYQQMNMVMTADHGFRVEGIVNVELKGMDYNTVRNEFSQLSDVTGIGAASHLPALGTNNTTDVLPAGNEEDITTSYFGVDRGYLDIMQLELVAGRNFPEQMPKEEYYLIVNETAVKRYGWDNPQEAVGQVVSVEDNPMEIIGVVKDFHYERLDEKIGPMALRYLPGYVNTMIVTINPERTKETLAALQEGWQKHTTRPFEYHFYKDDMRTSYGHFEVLMKMLGFITVLVVSIACLGLLGMVIFHVQHRSREIGIRKILGAEAKDILFTTGKSFFILILISYLIGGPLSWFVNDMWLQAYAYRIDFGVPSLLVGFVLVFGIAALTIGSQLYRAMHVNPVEILKED